MTEDQIERQVETRTDAADRALMSGRMTQDEYDRCMRAIAHWAEKHYETARNEVKFREWCSS